MEFKQYPSYKKSGVEWLGGVPEHWVGSKFKYIFQEKQHTKNMNLPFGAISFGSVVYKEDKANLTDELKENYQEVLQGEFLVNPLNLNYDLKSLRTALSKIDVVVSSGYFVLKLKNNTFNKRYLEYLLYIFDIRKMKTLGAGIRQTLTFRDMAVCDVAIPSACEQTQIASFLDYETFRIDNLIAKQEKLIELLEEQRKSIISHAVTKGLNPNAPMKDSGVEWLGEVPEHWMTPSSKHLLEIPITDGPHETPNFVDDGVPFISAEAISKGKIDFDKKRGYITPELNAIYSKKYSPKIEDIYMVKSGATTGKVAMVETAEEFNIWSPLAVFRCNKNKVLPKFLLAVFNSSHFYDALVLNWSYGTQQNIGMGVLSNIEIPCPPLKEQAEIIQHLDAQNTKFDKLISTQSQLIEKLKEYRSSIISHAVTGKIDVREFGA